jgi:hypothetical protein
MSLRGSRLSLHSSRGASVAPGQTFMTQGWASTAPGLALGLQSEQDAEAYSRAQEAYPVVVEDHLEAQEAHPGATETPRRLNWYY